MSHFTVLVIGEDWEKQLVPYKEYGFGRDDPDELKSLLVFEQKEDEYFTKYLKDTVTKVVMPDGRLLNTWDDEFRKAGSFGQGSDTHKVPEYLEKREFPFLDLYKSFEEYMKEWCGYEKRDKKKGKYGYWHNPNQKWDWYQIGGRWTGYFLLKEGRAGLIGEPGCGTTPCNNQRKADQVFKGDIDWGGMVDENRRNAVERWEKHKNDKHTWIYGISKDQKKEDYVECSSSPATFAVLMGGKWYERGEMGLVGDCYE